MNLRNQLQIFGIVEFDGVPVFEPILIANGHHNSMKLKYLERQARIARAKYIRHSAKKNIEKHVISSAV